MSYWARTRCEPAGGRPDGFAHRSADRSTVPYSSAPGVAFTHLEAPFPARSPQVHDEHAPVRAAATSTGGTGFGYPFPSQPGPNVTPHTNEAQARLASAVGAESGVTQEHGTEKATHGGGRDAVRRAGPDPFAGRGSRVRVPRLFDERHREPGAARRARRPEAGAPPDPLGDARRRSAPRPPVREVRARRRRRHGQLPPARRRRDLRLARPHGPGLHAAAPARRQARQL